MNRYIPQTKYNPTTRQISISLGRIDQKTRQPFGGGLRDILLAYGLSFCFCEKASVQTILNLQWSKFYQLCLWRPRLWRVSLNPPPKGCRFVWWFLPSLEEICPEVGIYANESMLMSGRTPKRESGLIDKRASSWLMVRPQTLSYWGGVACSELLTIRRYAPR